MAKSKSKAPAPSAPAPTVSANTAGFYKKSGSHLAYAPKAVHFPDKTSILVANHADYTYPVHEWSYYESIEAAYAAEGLEMPAPVTRESIAERIAARRAMTPEQKEAERVQRETDRISRLQEKHPDKAAKLQAKLEETQARFAERAALWALTPEERRAARKAKLERLFPELAAKREASLAERAQRKTARKR